MFICHFPNSFFQPCNHKPLLKNCHLHKHTHFHFFSSSVSVLYVTIETVIISNLIIQNYSNQHHPYADHVRVYLVKHTKNFIASTENS